MLCFCRFGVRVLGFKRFLVCILCGLALVQAVFAGEAENASQNPFTIVLLGPPGAGKGTLATRLEKSEGIPVVTVSQVLKNQMAQDATLKTKVKTLMDSGQFVPDAIITEILEKELKQKKYAKGVIFDGFPRTIAQCDFFKDSDRQINLFVVLDMSDEAIIKRMQGRRVHMESGRMYHVETMPPKVEGKDDVTGEALVQREDDKEDIVKARLQDYHEKTEPIIGWAIQEKEDQDGLVKNFVTVDVETSFDQVLKSLCQQTKKKDLSLKVCNLSLEEKKA